MQGANETNDESARKALADEIEQLAYSLEALANSTHTGLYLFAGQSVGQSLSVKAEQTFSSLSTRVMIRRLSLKLESVRRFRVSIPGDKIFEPVFDAIKQIYGELTGTAEGQDGLELLDEALDTVLSHQSHVGALQNRVELANERLKDLRLNVTELLGESQNIDYAETIMHLKMEEFAYRTALSVGARIIQPSLVDFLR